MQPMERRVQVRTRLLEGRVPQHVLDVMYRPTAFDQSGPALVAKVVEVQVDRPVRRLRLGAQLVEHRPYTPAVTGSSPVPPTSLRTRRVPWPGEPA